MKGGCHGNPQVVDLLPPWDMVLMEETSYCIRMRRDYEGESWGRVGRAGCAGGGRGSIVGRGRWVLSSAVAGP